MMRPLIIVACLALSATACAAPGQDSATAPAADAAAPNNANAGPVVGDPARGRQMTYTCQGCHGITGYQNAYPNFHVPKIGGQSEQYLVNALTAYKEGTRQHPTMQAQASGFSEQDIADIAAFLSSLDP